MPRREADVWYLATGEFLKIIHLLSVMPGNPSDTT
jgi:hypothetical protein